MSKIYIVTEGSYSDYHIVTVFSGREMADRFANNSGDYCDVEEYELDRMEPQSKRGLIPWSVNIGLDGEVIYTALVTTDLEHFKSGVVFMKGRHRYGDYGDELVITCYATDEKHALKIASEKRAEYIVSTGWHKDEGDKGREEMD